MTTSPKRRLGIFHLLWGIQVLIFIASLVICETVGLHRMGTDAVACELMNLLCIAMLMLMSLSCLRAPAPSNASRMFSSVLFFATVYLFLDSLGWVVESAPHLRWLNILVNLLYHMGSVLQTWLYWYFLCAWLRVPDSFRNSHCRYIDWLGMGACLLILGNLWGGYFYIIDYPNVFVRTRYYPVFLLMPAVILLFCVVLVFRYPHSPRERAILIIYPMMPFLGFLISLSETTTIYANVLLFLALFLFYNGLYVSRERSLLELQARLQEQHTQLMLSQIQPHFLYNSLGAISHLCKKDALLAREAIDSFARYLRINLDSVNQKESVPFSKELEHIRTYLWLEQLRFGDDLTVEYDIQTTDFLLPPLTMQPLVENAVKHGICRTEYGGTVTISTRRLETCVLLTVTDDGAGFDPSQPPPPDGRSHLGIENVRARLASLCGGQLSIESSPGKGTTATITLPLEVLP